MKPTIKDVAKRAGVSIATVSLVIHNHDRISAETKKKVLKAIKELKYHPSKSARNLVSQKTGNIGFILTDDHFLRTEPFYTKIFLGTEFEAREKAYYILLTTIKSDFSKDDALPRFVSDRNVDGIIIAGKVPDAFIDRLSNYNIPFIFIDYMTSLADCATVLIDNVQGGMLATKHLIEKGHKDIAFIGGDIDHPSIRDRLNGYLKVLEENKIKVNRKIIHTSSPYPNKQNGYIAAKKLFTDNNNISSVFACNDAMAIGVMQYLKSVGYKVPADVSVIGFDDVEADVLNDPQLTTISVPKVELGAEGLQLMDEVIQNRSLLSKKIIIPVELVVRESVGEINK